ncbi:MAG: Glycosyltransferases involved in cell wall bioproteini [Parcubacteria group bacterium Gr01-1014_106]|nr:MAG: Glycosyltransferases involved in cell wall bioproteini [Parcubacteria group bacterium Gr01-1014_106]
MPLAERTLVLIPTYNEADNIGLILDQIFSVEPRLSVLVIDDTSPDGTADVVKERMTKHPNLFLLLRSTNRGFAHSYRDGFRTALLNDRFEAVVTMDADFSHEPKELPTLIGLLEAGADVAVGSRHAQGGRFPGIALWRRILSRFANRYVRWILGTPFTDSTAGFIAMRASALRRVPAAQLRSGGYGILFELKYRLFRSGARIVEHPVAWPRRHQGDSKMTLAIMWDSFLLPWKIRLGILPPVRAEVPEASLAVVGSQALRVREPQTLEAER